MLLLQGGERQPSYRPPCPRKRQVGKSREEASPKNEKVQACTVTVLAPERRPRFGRHRKRNLGWALGATEAGEPPLLGFNTEGGPSRGSGPQFQRHCPFCSHPPFNGVPESSSPCWVRERGQKLSGPTPSPPQRSSAMLFLPLFLLSTPISDLALDLSPFLRSF